MTRKLVLVNMSNWADEAYEVTDGSAPATVLKPGEFLIVAHSETDVIAGVPIKVGQPNGYEPPRFPQQAIVYSEEPISD